MPDLSAINAVAPQGGEAAIILLTLEVAARAVALGAPLALALAVLLNRVFAPLRVILSVVVNLPLMLPPVVTGWLLLVVFGRQGPVGRILAERFQLHLAFTTNGAALACMVMSLPLLVRSIRQGLEVVDRGMLDAARTLGAGPLDRFMSITIPLALPGMIAGLVLAFTACLGEFGAVITFAASIPGVTQTLPLAIYAALSEPNGDAMAMRLSLFSIALACGGYGVSELVLRRLRR